jgi:hypothetical protein
VKPHFDGFHGLTALGGAMTYKKPEVRDFGNIAKHTYVDGGDEETYPGGSNHIIVDSPPQLGDS